MDLSASNNDIDFESCQDDDIVGDEGTNEPVTSVHQSASIRSRLSASKQLRRSARKSCNLTSYATSHPLQQQQLSKSHMLLEIANGEAAADQMAIVKGANALLSARK